MAKYIEIRAAEAIKAFKGQKIEVQEARPVKVKGEDGKVREAFDTKVATLTEKHILSGKRYEDGRITITTIDGQKYEAGAAVEATA